jgi:hypothetical protein
MGKTITANGMRSGEAIANDARKWLVLASLSMTAVLFVFFIIAPAFGFPLTFGQARGLLEIILPVFLGYLGSASHFVFSQRSARLGGGAELWVVFQPRREYRSASALRSRRIVQPRIRVTTLVRTPVRPATQTAAPVRRAPRNVVPAIPVRPNVAV